MPDLLPTGTVTFLFTDIEGSTRLAQLFPHALPAALARRRPILAQFIQNFDGYVFQIVGDAFCAAFHHAGDGLQAALGAQLALQAEPWGDCVITVRMGLHTGDAILRDGAYQNYLTLSRAQRIMSVAQGGQMLLSSTTESLLRDHLPAGVVLRDVGVVTLKDFPRAEHLVQVVAPGLPSDFSPPKSLRDTPNNLPVQLTSFVGRKREIAEVRHLLGSIRLLTLTGSGGTGKTRLSLKVAAELLDQFQDGIWFIELAPLTEPALVPQTVASVLGVREQPGRPIVESLTDYLRDKRLLLILDNCEHLLEACARFADAALRAAPQLTMLASSREALGIGGENVYRVPSLETPTANGGRQTAKQLREYAAVRLFVERAQAAKADFTLNDGNQTAVAQVCARLDGIPLAIELAAARVKVLPPEQIATRLDDRFRLLTGGSRTALPRQQTLRALIDWSHDLLTDPERVLLRRLSVFSGGWTLEAAETICADDAGPVGHLQSADILDLLTHLVDKSLVVADEHNGEARYHMLETVRQYAREKLLESGEGEALRARHLEFFVAFAERTVYSRMHLRQREFLDSFTTEQSNLRSAIEWSLESRKFLLGVRLALSLETWYQQRYPSEGIERLGELVSQPESMENLELHAKALRVAGYLRYWQGNYREAQALQEEALAIAKGLVDNSLVDSIVRNLAQVRFAQGDHLTARSMLTEVLQFRLNAGVVHSGVLMELGEISYIEGDLEQAYSLFQASVSRSRIESNVFWIPMTIRRLGQAALGTGDIQHASELIRESLRLNAEIDDQRAVAACLTSWAAIIASQDQLVEAIRFHAAAHAFLESSHLQLAPFDRNLTEASLTDLRMRVDPATFAAAWAEGRTLTLEHASELARMDSMVLTQPE